MRDSPLFRVWVKRDALRRESFRFSKTQRINLLTALRTRLEPTIEAQLIEALEGSIAYYKMWDVFERRVGSVAGTRHKITAVQKQISKLEAPLVALDWGTRRALAPFLVGLTEPTLPLFSQRKPDEMTILDTQIVDAFEAFMDLKQTMDLYLQATAPKAGGRRQSRVRDVLAVEIADQLDELAPGTVSIAADTEGAFEHILTICLHASGSVVGDVHRIALRAIPAYRLNTRPQGG